MFSVYSQGLSRIRTEEALHSLLLDGKTLDCIRVRRRALRREVDVRHFYEMFDHCVSQHEAVGVLAVIQFRMFAPTWPSEADSTNVQFPVQ